MENLGSGNSFYPGLSSASNKLDIIDSKATIADVVVGFSKLSKDERLAALLKCGILQPEDVQYLSSGGLTDTSLGEKFIENVLGYFQMPLGVATNFKIDNKDYVIPMAVEETSIVAAASKTAKWIRECGRIETRMLGQEIIGQIQFAVVQDFEKLQKIVSEQEAQLIARANQEVAFGMVRRGGGVTRLVLRKVEREDGAMMAILHVYMNPVDAMGANIVNQVCEFLKGPLEEQSGEKVTMCILSNLVDSKLTEAKVILENIEPELGHKITEASLFAKLDPYRAATNNKGVLNGIDPILLATGNDWRAVEAGVHAYAARDGQYRSITSWQYADGKLIGTLVAPIIVGTVGGVTSLHPTAALCLRILGAQSAAELSRIVAAVGLVQNLGALKALTTVGIIEGHMKLHIKNLTLAAGATEAEIPELSSRLEQVLHKNKRISLSHALAELNELRGSQQPKPLDH